jgi:hypothetical protein
MTQVWPVPPPGAGGWQDASRVVVFRESLRGLVRAVDAAPTGDDRLECALAVETVLVPGTDADPARSCVLQDLVIAVDVDNEPADGGLAGVVRSGRVVVDGAPELTVRQGEFELFPRVPGDARRMRYRLWLRDPDGGAWFLRGTKLVVDELRGSRLARMWTETTTLYIVLVPEAGGPVRAGVVQVRAADLARQLVSLHGEPGPAGGLRAVGRLLSAFTSVLAEVYLRGAASPAFPPGLEAAFTERR